MPPGSKIIEDVLRPGQGVWGLQNAPEPCRARRCSSKPTSISNNSQALLNFPGDVFAEPRAGVRQVRGAERSKGAVSAKRCVRGGDGHEYQ